MTTDNKRLNALYGVAFSHGLAKTKGDFAKFVGVKQSTMSRCFNYPDDDGSADMMIMRTENALFRAGVPIEQVISGSPGAANVVGDNNVIGIPPKKFAHDKKLLALLEEKDKQIARLLGIIETLSAKVHE